MSVEALIREAQASGVALCLVGGKIKAGGPREAVERLLTRLREHKEALVDALQTDLQRQSANVAMDDAFEPKDWKALDLAYQRHHFKCPQCIAAGRGSRYGKRCSIGRILWSTYGGTDDVRGGEG